MGTIDVTDHFLGRLDAIVGNWNVSGVHRYLSGVAMAISGSSQTLANGGLARCSFVAGQSLTNPNWDPTDPLSPYLNRAAFVQPANFTYGDVPTRVAQLLQPNQLGEDLAASKNFHFQCGQPSLTGGLANSHQ
ncbi:MAG TPA: hypothetical protein VEX68_06165 [Bryobacteraceae bacterium]|nr:hypothetical protein [Bryobacteraceae bacterium]